MKKCALILIKTESVKDIENILVSSSSPSRQEFENEDL